ncbi:cytochrome b5-like heme/steroid binding domain-containing protein [Gaertneriomyces semiglobifer]|nr:cytochrome b5-like heme/steroid binding domain-containing protein [Gaertneriomyces semiglobifer]
MTEVRTFDWPEIAAHNTRDDLWMVVDGKVYDCTKFLDEHPGGEEVMIEQAGQDASEAFDEIGHSDDARDLLKTMYIGDLSSTAAQAKAPKAAQKPLTTANQNGSPS